MTPVRSSSPSASDRFHQHLERMRRFFQDLPPTPSPDEVGRFVRMVRILNRICHQKRRTCSNE